jgi:drug/metabolite transporter (DMT)-like permease
MAIGFVGIAIMAGTGLAHGQILGDALALGSTVAYALLVVAMRAERAAEDMVPMLIVGAAVATGVGALLAPDLAVTLRDLGLAVVLGAGTSFLAYVLITLGARHVRAGELTLLASVEMVLGPTWVWLIVEEVPAAMALMGGAFVIVAIVVQGVVTARAGGA